MGIIKQAKAHTLGADARRAAEEGRTVFVSRLNAPISHHALSGSIPGWAEMIEAIEAEGWRLDQWTVSSDRNDRIEAYPLFRRV